MTLSNMELIHYNSKAPCGFSDVWRGDVHIHLRHVGFARTSEQEVSHDLSAGCDSRRAALTNRKTYMPQFSIRHVGFAVLPGAEWDASDVNYDSGAI